MSLEMYQAPPMPPGGYLQAVGGPPQDAGGTLNQYAQQPQGNLLDQARSQYPILKNYDYGYVENHQPNAGFLEHWEPGDPGAAPTSPGDLNALRPQGLPIDKPGLEIRDPNTRPIDVLGDIASHHMINTDPVVKQTYQDLQNSVTPNQQAILQDQYKYAQQKEGEKGSFEDWKDRAGMPGLFRGYAFQQWPSDFNQRAYTPDQMKKLDGMMSYLRGGAPPMASSLGRASQDKGR